MGLAIAAPEDVCNAALAQLGWVKRIGSLYEGSRAAKTCLDIYGQERQAKLRSFPWGFAEGIASPLTLIKAAPVGGYSPITPYNPTIHPILPWIFEYAEPSDLLKLRSLRSPTTQIPNFDPRPVLFRIANDTVSYGGFVNASQKVILSNEIGAACVYTRDVTDPTQWEAGFTQGLIDTIARKISAGFTQAEFEKEEMQEEIGETVMAQEIVG